ncbi:phospholipase D family protein [Staphylococcus arlettae]|uniref:phospholipase D family protein n=2 Tax=Staphylococcus arlettae TaxID=29378 RepID=UPI0011A056D5|nr:phospholipase D family protein [Staphylococcus arlettae]
MNLYYENLYENIIKESFEKYDVLNVISGYASASFVNLVLNDFPNKEINLYIGMAQQGISKEDHYKFCEICKQYPNVNIYYQTEDVPTHIKALEFTNNNNEYKKLYIGSANFSETGFMKHREVMTAVNDSLEVKLREQYKISTSCTNPTILKHINLIDQNHFESGLELLNKNKNKRRKIDKCIEEFNKKNNIHFNKHNNGSLEYLSLPIIIKDTHYDETSIYQYKSQNFVFHSHLQRKKMVDYFKRNHVFTIKTFINKKTSVELKGTFGKELYFYDFDFYDLVKDVINKPRDQVLTNDDLKEFGSNSFYFKKINDKEFLMTLHNNNEI